MIKVGSHWVSDNKEFEVWFIGKNSGIEEDTIFYKNILTKESYSCWEGAFRLRFKETQNYT